MFFPFPRNHPHSDQTFPIPIIIPISGRLTYIINTNNKTCVVGNQWQISIDLQQNISSWQTKCSLITALDSKSWWSSSQYVLSRSDRRSYNLPHVSCLLMMWPASLVWISHNDTLIAPSQLAKSTVLQWIWADHVTHDWHLVLIEHAR